LHKLAAVIQQKAGDATQLVVLARRGQYAHQIGFVDILGIRDAVVNQFVHWVFAVKSNGVAMLQAPRLTINLAIRISPKIRQPITALWQNH
jgi:hypothetical protein